MRIRSEISLAFAVCCFLAACSHSGLPVAPFTSGTPGVGGATPGTTPGAASTPTPRVSATPSPPPTATPGASTMTPVAAASGATATIANAVAGSIETYWETLPHVDRAADTASVATFMQSLSSLQDVVIGDGGDTAWAVLPDGSTYTYFLDRGGPYTDAPSVTSSARTSGLRRPADIVRTNASYVAPDATARALFLVDDVSFSPVVPRDQIVPALHARGYANATYGSLSVGAALGLKGSPISMLYFSTHGGQKPANAAKGTAPLFGLLTTTFASPSNDAMYAAQLAKSAATGNLAQLGYASLPGSGTARYTLQTPFFAANLSLASTAFVYFDACHTSAPDAGAQGLIATLEAQSPGLVYLGWTKSVDSTDADETAAFVFDRTLGESVPALFPGPPSQENPPERPFSLEEIVAYGTTRNREDGRSGVETTSCIAFNVNYAPKADGCIANLVETSGTTSNLALVPSLSGMSQSSTGIVSLIGEFPTGSGSFSIDGGSGSGSSISPLAVSPTDASFQASTSGSGSAGYVTYALAGGQMSNALALSDYSASLQYSLGFTAMDSFASAPDGSSCPGGSWNSSINGSDSFSVDAKIFLEVTRPLPGATIAPDAVPTTAGSFNASSTATGPQFSGKASGTSGEGQFDSSGAFTGCSTVSLAGGSASAGGTPAFGNGLPINGNFLYPFFNGSIAIAPGAQPATIALNFQLWPIGTGSGDLFVPVVPPISGTADSVNLVRHYMLPTSYDPTAFAVGNATHKTQGTTPDGFTYISIDHGIESDEIDLTPGSMQYLPRASDGR